MQHQVSTRRTTAGKRAVCMLTYFLLGSVQVYLTLALALLSAAAGVYANIALGIGGWLGIIGFVVCSVWLASTPSIAQTLNKRWVGLSRSALRSNACGCTHWYMAPWQPQLPGKTPLTAVLVTLHSCSLVTCLQLHEL